MHIEQLLNEAQALHRKLNDAAYARLCVYSRLPYYEKRVETDPYIVRLDAVLARSARRILRRLNIDPDVGKRWRYR